VVPPLVFRYQDDSQVRQMGHEKLIGRDLLVAVVARHGEHTRNIYLPVGAWVNYHTRDWFRGNGQWVDNFPIYIDGVLRLPAFARAGSLVPLMHVDERTKDTFGNRTDGTSDTDLLVQVIADSSRSTFTLYEDDGTTVSFDAEGNPIYATRTTELMQQLTGSVGTITIDAAAGTYAGATAQRNNVVRLIVDDARATAVTLNGGALTEAATAEALAAASSGWVNAERNLVLMKSGVLSVGTRKTFSAQLTPTMATVTANFVCDNAWTALGEQIVVTGNDQALGNWDPAKGVVLSPSIYYCPSPKSRPGKNR
jgi:hypothetical protein